jgi:hypothetical protein
MNAVYKPFILHLHWDDFLEQCPDLAVVYVGSTTRNHRVQNIPVSQTSYIVASYIDEHDIVNATRLYIETVDIMQHQKTPQEFIDRIDQATAIVSSAIEARQQARGVLRGGTRGGVIVQPGLTDELTKIEATHNLWRWEGNGRDAAARQLVASEQWNQK